MTPPPCPHCGTRVVSLSAHVRDTGAVTILPADACPTLYARRNQPATT